MAGADFLRSAQAVVPILARPQRHVGEMILDAVRASVDAVRCNTNLGIVLLAAPITRAALEPRGGVDLRGRLRTVLRSLSARDTNAVFAAIRYANPAGLGRAAEEDVSKTSTRALREVMALAAMRDRIAFQYAYDYEDIFALGVPQLRYYRDRWASMRWASIGVYLAFLSRYPDSHVARKHGPDKARALMREAQTLERDFKACENPATFTAALEKFDRELKGSGVNPGTSADLTVASLLTLLLFHR